MAADPAPGTGKPCHGSALRAHCCHRHPPDVHGHRHRADRPVRRHLLAAPGKCGQHRPGSSGSGCGGKIQGQEDQITGSALFPERLHGDYRARHLRCEPAVLQAFHRRMYRRRLRSPLRLHRPSGSKGNRRDRHLRHPALPGHTGAVPDRDGDRCGRCLCHLLYPL